MEILHAINRIFLLIIWSASSCTPMPEALTMGKDAELIAAQFTKWKEGEASIFDTLAEEVEWTVSGSAPVSGTYHSNHIDYKDDTGFTADGEFKDGILYHVGMVLYKESN